MLLGGCVDGTRRAPGDTTAPDTQDAIDTQDTQDAIGTQDAIDAQDTQDTQDTIGTQDAIDTTSDVAPAGCQAGEPDSSPCDDGNACTSGERCDDGVCTGGSQVVCDEATPCGRSVCDPNLGCVIEPLEGRVCEAAIGLAWGTCMGERMAPPDQCGAGGLCVEQAISTATPIPKDDLLGDWYVVMTIARDVAIAMASGTFIFEADGTWRGANLNGVNGPVLPDSLDPRGWCLDDRGGLGFGLAINDFTGQVAEDGEVFTASGELGNELVIGVRPREGASALDGTYAALVVDADATGAPRIWHGPIAFEAGCIADDEAPRLSTADGDLDLEILLDGPRCAVPTQDVLVTMSYTELLADSETVNPVSLTGAVGEGGKLAIFQRNDGANLERGMVVLVKLSSGTPSMPTTGTTDWFLAHQDDQGGSARYRGFPALLRFEGEQLVGGRFGDALTTSNHIIGRRLAFGPNGRVALDVQTPSERRTLSGQLGPDGSFGFLFGVEAAPDFSDASDVSEHPTGTSMGFFVRRNP